MAAETQTFLDEAATPSITGPGPLRSAIGALAPAAGSWEQQVAQYAELLKAAEITEADAGVYAMFEEGFQKIGAMRREIEESERHLRALVRAGRGFVAWLDQLRAVAQAAGYN